MSKKITFIVGQRRSGTSLVRAILGSHKDIYCPPNDWDILSLIEKLSIIDHKALKWDIDWKLYEESSFIFMNSLLENAYRNYKDKERVIKKPNYETRYEELKTIYKDIQLIYISRNPKSIVASRKYYPKGLQWNETDKHLFYDICSSIVFSYNTYEFIKEEGDIPIIKIKYENLVENPQKQIEEMCKFIGVEYYKELLNYTKEWQMTLDSSLLNSIDYSTIYMDSIDKWKNYLTLDEQNYIDILCKDIIKKENYT